MRCGKGKRGAYFSVRRKRRNVGRKEGKKDRRKKNIVIFICRVQAALNRSWVSVVVRCSCNTVFLVAGSFAAVIPKAIHRSAPSAVQEEEISVSLSAIDHYLLHYLGMVFVAS